MLTENTTNDKPLIRVEQAVEFLAALRPKGPWVLVAIHAENAKRIVTKTFTNLEQAREFIVSENEDGCGVYYSVNPTRAGVSSKPSKADIATVEYLHADVDPHEGEPREEIKTLIDKFEPIPTFVLDSGNGYHLLWRLREPVPLDDEITLQDVEARNHALAVELGADVATRNVDRILRLPGTINWPSEAKRKRGRTECRAKWIEHNDDCAFKLEEFPRHEPGGTSHQDDSGSGFGFRFLQDCKRQDLNFEQACEQIRADQGKAGEWARRSDERQLHRAWENANVRPNIHSWETPDVSLLDDRRGELPDFPLGLLPEALEKVVRRVAKGAGVLPDHVALLLLGVASSLIGSARRAQPAPSWSSPLTCWSVLIGDSGDGKTPALEAIKRPLDEAQDALRDMNKALRQDHQERTEKAAAIKSTWMAAVKQAAKNGDELPEKPRDAEDLEPFVAPRLYAIDVTIERMAQLLQVRPRGMLLLEDELAGLFANLSRYSRGNDKTFWLKTWNGGAHSVERKTAPPIEVPNLLVGIVGGMQPDKLVECFAGAADGMYARFLYAWPPRAPYQSLSASGAEIDDDLACMFDTIVKLEDHNTVALSGQAVEVFEDLRELVHKEINQYEGRARDWCAKVPAHVLRLAGTLTYVEWALTQPPGKEPKLIKARFVEDATALVREYFWPHAQACLRQIGLSQRHADARRVLRWLLAKGLKEVSREQVRCDALGRQRDADAAQEVIAHLTRAGWLRSLAVAATGPKGGRPALRWEINPRLSEHS